MARRVAHGFFVVDRESGWVIGSADSRARRTIPAWSRSPTASSQAVRGVAMRPSRGRLVRFAFASEHVRLVRAHTLPLSNPSTRVLQKCGFRYVGAVVDPRTGRCGVGSGPDPME